MVCVCVCICLCSALQSQPFHTLITVIFSADTHTQTHTVLCLCRLPFGLHPVCLHPLFVSLCHKHRNLRYLHAPSLLRCLSVLLYLWYLQAILRFISNRRSFVVLFLLTHLSSHHFFLLSQSPVFSLAVFCLAYLSFSPLIRRSSCRTAILQAALQSESIHFCM